MHDFVCFSWFQALSVPIVCPGAFIDLYLYSIDRVPKSTPPSSASASASSDSAPPALSDASLQPFGLLCRSPLPNRFNPLLFPLYARSVLGEPKTDFALRLAPAPVRISSAEFKMLTTFGDWLMRLWLGLRANRTGSLGGVAQSPLPSLSTLLFVPLLTAADGGASAAGASPNRIDWKLMERVLGAVERPVLLWPDVLQAMSPAAATAFLQDKVLTTPFNDRRYRLCAVRPDLSPLSPAPRKSAADPAQSFKEYYHNRYALAVRDSKQWLLEVRAMPGAAKNALRPLTRVPSAPAPSPASQLPGMSSPLKSPPPEPNESKTELIHLIPEQCSVLCDLRLVQSASLLPSIAWHLCEWLMVEDVLTDVSHSSHPCSLLFVARVVRKLMS